MTATSLPLPDVDRRGRWPWLVLAAATFAQLSAGFLPQSIGSLAVQLQSDLGVSGVQVGLLVSAAQLAPLVGLLVVGELLDRVEERWVVGIGCLVLALGLAVGGLVEGYGPLLAAMLVVGAGYCTVQPGGSKVVAGWFSPARRGLAMGIRQAGLPLGALAGSATLPLLAATAGWRTALLVAAALAVLGAVAFVALCRPAPDAVLPEADAGPRTSRRALLRVPTLRRAVLAGAVLIGVQYGLGLLGVLHLHERAGLTVPVAGAVVAAAYGAGAAGRVLLAVVSSRPAGRERVVRASMAASLAALLLLATPLGASAAVACGALVWLGFFGIGWYGPWVTVVAESAPAGRTGLALGLAMTTNQVVIVLAPPLLGLLYDLAGTTTLGWSALALTTGLALAGATLSTRRG